MTALWPPDRRLLARPGFWLAIGVLVRLVHLMSLGNKYYFGDTVEYEQVALRLLHGVHSGGANPRQPLYPLLLAISFWIGGEQNFFVARLVQLIAAIVQMGLLVRLTRSIGGAPAAAVAAPLVALAPTLVFVTGLLYPTLLYSTVLLAVTVVAWNMAERPTPGRGAWLGALIVLGALTDLVFFAPVMGILVWLLVTGRRHGPAFTRAIAASGVTALLLATPVLLGYHSPGGGRVFMSKAQNVLYFARSDTTLARERWIRVEPGEAYQPLPPAKFAHHELRLFQRRPLAFIHDYLLELLHFFKPLADRVTSVNKFNTLPVLLIGAVWFVGLLSLSLVGLLAGAGPPRGRLLLATVVFATAAFYSFFFTQARYRIPIDPQIIVLAALGVASAFPRFCQLLAEAGAGPAAEPAP